MPLPLAIVGVAALYAWAQNQGAGGDMQLSVQGLEFIKSREGFSAYSYPDAGGRSTGYGHFIQPGENLPDPISEPDAASLLLSDTQTAQNGVNNAVAVVLTQYQFDALCDFAYNAGVGALNASTLLKKVNAGDWQGAAQEFGRWVYTHDSNGNKVVSPALQTRRQLEAQLFATGVYA